MIRAAKYFALGILLLCSATGGAEKYVHDFHTMTGASTIAFSGANKVGTTDLVTYTCSASAVFSATAASSSRICIFLEKNGDEVVLSPAIANLDSLSIYYLPVAARTIDVYVSTDGSDWGEKLELTESVAGIKLCKLPEKGNYYLRIVNSKYSNAFYISQIDFFTKPCYCLKVVSE